jgi:hypothetical protein
MQASNPSMIGKRQCSCKRFRAAAGLASQAKYKCGNQTKTNAASSEIENHSSIFFASTSFLSLAASLMTVDTVRLWRHSLEAAMWVHMPGWSFQEQR